MLCVGGAQSVGKDASLRGTLAGAVAMVMVSVMVLQPRWGVHLSWPDWEKESYPAAKDLLMMPLFAVLFPTVRFFFDHLILEVKSSFSSYYSFLDSPWLT